MKRVLVALIGLTLLLPTVSQVAQAADAYDGVVMDEGVITDRYGDNLKAFYFFPANGGVKATGRFPVILTLQYPNPKDYEQWRLQGVPADSTQARFARMGYVFVNVNWGGTAPSDGWDGFFTRRMQRSGYDVVEWLAGFRADGSSSPAAAWSTGKVGMFGGSGMGLSQIFVAQHQPPHLVAITPHVAVVNGYEDFFYRGGMRTNAEAAVVGYLYFSTQAHCASVPNDESEVAAIGACARKRAENLQIAPPLLPLEWWQHPTYTPYWEELTADVSKIKAAIWSLGSWDDHFLRGNITLYEHGGTPNRMLAVGWGGHSIGQGFDLVGETARWFDYWLKSETNNGIAEDITGRRFRYYTLGEGVWHEAPEWPIPSTQFKDLYLDGNAPIALATGALAESASASAGTDSFQYDPAQGRHNGELGLVCKPGQVRENFDPYDVKIAGANAPNCPGDQRLESVDSPTYLGESLVRDTEVTGPISMTLYASSTATDTDWVVKLIDVFPDGTTVSADEPQPGYWNLVTTGWLKGTHRSGHVTPEPIPVGQVVGYNVELRPTSYLFKAGHRIGIQIASADASRTVPNDNPATNTIWHTVTYPSHVTLPIIPR